MAAPARDPNRHLVSLDELDDFKVADEDPDPRGWDIFARDGRRIGEVDELIVDTSAMKVRYLDCDLDEEELGIEDRDRHVLIPVGRVRIDEGDKKVTVDAISSVEVVDLPPFTGDLTMDYDEQFAMLTSRGGVTEASRRLGEAGPSPDVRVQQQRGRPSTKEPGE